VVRRLTASGIAAAAIHGNKSQNNRDRALADFRDGRVRTLVATDIAARGIDVDGITHVVNFDLPHVPDTYVHRIGRTARAGADGTAVSLCDAEEVALLRDIEKLIRKSISASGQRSSSSPSARPAPDHAGHRGRSSQPSRAKRNGRGRGPTNGHPQQNGSAGQAFRNGDGKSDNRQQFRRRRRRKSVQFDRAQAGG
jgi:superfamily II DNA/RNA helicase